MYYVNQKLFFKIFFVNNYTKNSEFFLFIFTSGKSFLLLLRLFPEIVCLYLVIIFGYL